MTISPPPPSADPQHQVNVGPQPEDTFEKAAKCCVKMGFIADAAFINTPNCLVEIDTDAAKLLVRSS
jgi:hypothetical protein